MTEQHIHVNMLHFTSSFSNIELSSKWSVIGLLSNDFLLRFKDTTMISYMILSTLKYYDNILLTKSLVIQTCRILQDQLNSPCHTQWQRTQGVGSWSTGFPLPNTRRCSRKNTQTPQNNFLSQFEELSSHFSERIITDTCMEKI